MKSFLSKLTMPHPSNGRSMESLGFLSDDANPQRAIVRTTTRAGRGFGSDITLAEETTAVSVPLFWPVRPAAGSRTAPMSETPAGPTLHSPHLAPRTILMTGPEAQGWASFILTLSAGQTRH